MSESSGKISGDNLALATGSQTFPSDSRPQAEALADLAVDWVRGHPSEKPLGEKIQESLLRLDIPLSPRESAAFAKGLLVKTLTAAMEPLQPIMDGKVKLSKGSERSLEVGLIQDLLREQGFPVADGGGQYRGVFGSQTDAAVRAYQSSRGLKADGVVGRQTLRSLMGFPEEMASPPPPVREPIAGAETPLLQLIAEFESFEPRVYLDQGGKPTIGFGHLLKPGEADTYAKGITREEGIRLLQADAADAMQSVESLVQVPLNTNQYNALVSFVFNVGCGQFKSSTLLRELNAGRYERVSTEMNRWIHTGGKVSRGLQNRREMEGMLFDLP